MRFVLHLRGVWALAGHARAGVSGGPHGVPCSVPILEHDRAQAKVATTLPREEHRTLACPFGPLRPC